MKIHFIGIKGVSMSALAAIAKRDGQEVTGSDLKLKGHSPKFITKDIDLVVYTNSITPGSDGFVELDAAKKLGIKCQSRGQYLATLVNNAKDSIVVSGMHGKTTVTTMIGLILKSAKKKPTVLPGTFIKEFSNNYLLGDKELLVTEGCEYFDSFLHLSPTIAVITNIEEEHLDYFKDLNSIINSFAKFISNILPSGALVYSAADENIQEAIKRATRRPNKMIPYGQLAPKYKSLDYQLRIPGEHNKLNALAASAVASLLNVEPKIIKRVLTIYQGAGRRFEIKGEFKNILFVDDYGHHPSEIKATIAAAKEAYPHRRLVVAFWPHQFQRIKSLFSKFVGAFDKADEVHLMPIYFVPGRDQIENISSNDITRELIKRGVKAFSHRSQSEMVDYLVKNLKADDLLLTIGIPPIYEVADSIILELK